MEKKTKAPNWTEKETEILLSEVYHVYGTLVSKLGTSTTIAKKQRLWSKICERVNAAEGNRRDVNSCKKRWRDVKSTFLQKKVHAAKTGGGKAAPSCPYEDLVGQILGESSSLTQGIAGSGGFDTAHQAMEPTTEQMQDVATASVSVQEYGREASDMAITDSQQDSPQPSCSSMAINLPAALQTTDREPVVISDTQIRESNTSLDISSQQGMSQDNADRLRDRDTHTHTEMNRATDRQTGVEAGSFIFNPTTSSTPQLQRKKRKMTFVQSMTSASTAEDEESRLTKAWLQSEIEKNQSDVEVNKLKKIKLELQIAQLKKQM